MHACSMCRALSTSSTWMSVQMQFFDEIEGQENGNMNHCYIISHAKSTRARCPTIATPYTHIQVTEQLLCEYFCDFLLVS